MDRGGLWPRAALTCASKARGRWWALLVLGLLLLTAWAGAAYYTSCPVPINPVVWDEATARRQVATALPLGSTRQQVLAWLQANSIPHDDDANAQCGIVRIFARKPYTGWLFDRGMVGMEFDFDCSGKLVDEKTHNWIASL